eukprot:5973187-Prorocentrum_lima.AAC.1
MVGQFSGHGQLAAAGARCRVAAVLPVTNSPGKMAQPGKSTRPKDQTVPHAVRETRSGGSGTSHKHCP